MNQKSKTSTSSALFRTHYLLETLPLAKLLFLILCFPMLTHHFGHFLRQSSSLESWLIFPSMRCLFPISTTKRSVSS